MRYVRNETNGGNRMEGETIERYSLGQTNFDYRYYSYYSLDDGFLLVSLDSASQHLSLLRRTLFYSLLSHAVIQPLSITPQTRLFLE